jgi:hypothetical protein
LLEGHRRHLLSKEREMNLNGNLNKIVRSTLKGVERLNDQRLNDSERFMNDNLNGENGHVPPPNGSFWRVNRIKTGQHDPRGAHLFQLLRAT